MLSCGQATCSTFASRAIQRLTAAGRLGAWVPKTSGPVCWPPRFRPSYSLSGPGGARRRQRPAAQSLGGRAFNRGLHVRYGGGPPLLPPPAPSLLARGPSTAREHL